VANKRIAIVRLGYKIEVGVIDGKGFQQTRDRVARGRWGSPVVISKWRLRRILMEA
jgi:hypothetical protein